MSEAIRIERVYDVENEQRNAMNAVADKAVKREVMASFYADCLIAEARRTPGSVGIDWPKLNNAIIARWSTSAFMFIKELAWREAKTGKPAFLK